MHALWHALQANYSRVLAWVCSHAIVSSLVGPEYYVNIMSFVDKSQLEPGCSILLHNKVCWKHNVCTNIAVYLLCCILEYLFPFLMSLSGMAGAVSRGHSAGRSRSIRFVAMMTCHAANSQPLADLPTCGHLKVSLPGGLVCDCRRVSAEDQK